MKRLILLLFSGLFFYAGAAPLIPLPETTATVDGVRIPASVIRDEWNRITQELPDNIPPESPERIYKNLTEQYIWKREIREMLAESGQKINRETAEKFLKIQQKKYSFNAGKISPEKLTQLLNSPRFQLKSAIHFYLNSTVPEKLQVTRTEVENIYRSMPEKFKVPGKENWGLIEVRERQNAETVRALLLQGSSFESVAKRFSPQGIKSPLPRELIEQGKKMKVNEISPVIKSENGWIVAKLHSREKSSIVPLEKVYSQLALELEDAKESAVLAEILRQRLSRKKIIYFPLKQ